jgi:hypothetical protein
MPARSLAATLVLCACLVAAPAAHARPHARAVLVACERGDVQADRAGVFEGQMRTVPGAERMQMRFTLQARPSARERWTAVALPGFGTWVASDPGTARYVYTKRVENLLAPASYRVALRFRWLDAGGKRIAGARAYSAGCRQPDPRANLVVDSIDVEAGADPARRRYVVLVRNSGRATSGPTELALTLDGEPAGAAAVPELPGGGSTLATVPAPACGAGSVVAAQTDAGDAVDERNEADNGLSLPCPAPFA